MSVSLDGVTKRFGSFVAVNNVSFDVDRGEIFTLLGPSGCGKTTVLKIIAGLFRPNGGRVYIDGRDVTDLPPERRDTGMVFQSYALWPHMTVYENIAFGLRLRRLPEDEIRRRVREALELVKLEGFESRYPIQLSGGQQQRVALARALVINPKVLLLDEPLSNLDAKLREELRYDIRELIKKLGITAIYVTHDQTEAFVLSDRIAVMDRGRIVQIGRPYDIYENPRSRYVASFIGSNILIDGVLKGVRDGYGVVRIGSRTEILGVLNSTDPTSLIGKQVTVVIKPEAIEIRKGATGLENLFSCTISRATYMGGTVEHRAQCGEFEVKFYTPSDSRIEEGSIVELHISPRRTIVIAE
ncbi:MAG: ABC transporter ATP-binding protein [Ignisphaera sp.]|nr:ABC transporter ATP-binding protein [Ignisphaera sp.]MDW8085629.1 ABC transporter ATP-binding protein [Ignisphaera sp.]